MRGGKKRISVGDEKALDREWVARESAIAGLLLPHSKLSFYSPTTENTPH